MTPRTTRAVVLAAVVALLAAACGSGDGDDADSTVPTPVPTPPETDLFTQVEDGGDPADDDAPPPDGSVEPVAATSTTVAGTAAPSADAESSEVDADAVASSVADGERSGTGDPATDSPDAPGADPDRDDPQGDDRRDGPDEVSAGPGTGVVTVDGVDYAFTADLCMVGGGDFIVEGPGTTVDRIPFWGSISASSEFDFDGDGTLDDTLDILVQVGKEDPFGSASDGQPDLSATKLDGGTTQLGEDIEYRIEGSRISGSGPIEDFNSVLAPLGETLPMTFQASCA